MLLTAVRWIIVLALVASLHGRVGAVQVTTADQRSSASREQKQSSSNRFNSAESAKRDKWQKPDEVIREMKLKPGDVVADIGAGSGYFTRRFAEAVGEGGKAIGIEIKASLVRAMTADARRWGLGNYEARLVSPEDPLLEAGSVDVIFLCDTYHHIDNRIEYFARVRPALRPGGRLVILDFVRTNDNGKHSVVREEVLEEMGKAGYRLTKELDLLMPRQYFFEFEPERAPTSAGGVSIST